MSMIHLNKSRRPWNLRKWTWIGTSSFLISTTRTTVAMMTVTPRRSNTNNLAFLLHPHYDIHLGRRVSSQNKKCTRFTSLNNYNEGTASPHPFVVEGKGGYHSLYFSMRHYHHYHYHHHHHGRIKCSRIIRHLSSSDTDLKCNSYDMTTDEKTMRRDAHAILSSSVQAVDPKVAIQTYLSATDKMTTSDNVPTLHIHKTESQVQSYNENDYDKVLIAAFGKASAAMTEATCEILSKAFPNTPLQGITIIKDDHATQEQIQMLQQNFNITTYSASHPVPDERSVHAANEIKNMIQTHASERTLLFTLISGGGSALFCSPQSTLSLQDLMQTNICLLQSGMNIQQMNTIRKRLEDGTKGGQLATLAYPCRIVTCVLSDVIGDPLDLIASGPTTPDDYANDSTTDSTNDGGANDTWTHVWKLIESYNALQTTLPPNVLQYLEKGKRGELSDLPKRTHPTFQNSHTVLVGNNDAAVKAAAQKAEMLGYHPLILSTSIEGEAQHVANMYVSMAHHIQTQAAKKQLMDDDNDNHDDDEQTNPNYLMASSLPVALIAGGETTVTLPSSDNNYSGKGGRNQEIGLVAALTMKEKKIRNMILASIGTDGTDGPTDAAGAMVDGGTIDRVESILQHFHDSTGGGGGGGVGPIMTGTEALKYHDSYTFFHSEWNYNHGTTDDDTADGTDILDTDGNSSKEEDSMCFNSLIKTGPTGTNVADVCVVLVK